MFYGDLEYLPNYKIGKALMGKGRLYLIIKL